MKRILITGANSYIGMSFEKYIEEKYSNDYKITTIDMIDGSWRSYDFSKYDVVFHVAGIAHKKIKAEAEGIYYEINTNLAIEVAEKAKNSGIKQFVFMSSASIYGDSAPIGKEKIITKNTIPNPTSAYGKSKLLAEKGLERLSSDEFRVAILRPPMIYGPGCKGNYTTLSKIAHKTFVFPVIDNKKSLMFIDNFTEMIRLVIKNEESGVFWPQNKEYANTTEIVKTIASINSKKILFLKGFSWGLKIMAKFVPAINKAFGNLCYDMDLSKYKEDYRLYDLQQSLEKTEINGE